MELLSGAKNVHVVGAGGIGLSAAAKLLFRRGHKLSASDVQANEATAELAEIGLPVAIGHRAENLPDETEAVIFSDAVPDDNPERQAAARRGLPQFSYFDFLGQLSRQYRTVAVSGTNGKSTVTALLGLMLVEAGLDPTVVVGSKVNAFPDRNLRVGKSDLLVVEACEYRANMLKLSPQTIVLTNLEPDHLDFYGDFAAIKRTFQDYLDGLPKDGRLITNADDANLRDFRCLANTVSYGLEHPADYQAYDCRAADGQQGFQLNAPNGELARFLLNLPGRHNVSNALAALVAALELGANPESLRQTLANFPGIWRRFERLGQFNGALVISDYGHTPNAVRLTLEAARQFYPDREITLCFQPHHRNRTRQLFNEFVSAMDQADRLELVEIYDVAGREEAQDATVSSRQLVEAVCQRDREAGRDRPVEYRESEAAAEQALRDSLRKNQVALIMGAGNIYQVAESLVRKP